LAAICKYDGPLLVDLDETLYLRNSTEDFINCSQPRLLSLLLLRLLDVIKPWRLTGGTTTRDNWRLCAVSMFFPWVAWYWRMRVPSLAAAHTNKALSSALAESVGSLVVVTSGFRPIVMPLLNAMGFTGVPVVASRMFSFADRRFGKLRMAVRQCGVGTVAQSLVVTDSLDDMDLLQSCARPLRTLWPQARYEPAFRDVYLPGKYISHVKHPGERYIFRGILQEDFAFWLLSSISLAADPVLHAIALLFLLFSFWALYERGYVDNDIAASRYESDPVLSAAFGRRPVATPALQPWVWALFTGAIGTALLCRDRQAFTLHFALWMGALVAMYACFMCYNRLDKMSRVWLYPILQFARSGAFLAVVPIEPVGVAALGAHVLSRWVPYQFYRLGSTDWPSLQPELIRLLSFILLAILIACSLGVTEVFTLGGLALLLWNLFRARRDILKVVTSARRLTVAVGRSGPSLRSPHEPQLMTSEMLRGSE
jgi:hypothetical protein